MLQSLYIQNYALIDILDISFTSGFSVITGETGAGKSIILGALGILLGQRADIKAIKSGESKCIVEANFKLANHFLKDFFLENDLEYDPEECILRREVYATGKSRAFINDSPVSLVQMRTLGEQLIDIHSQHKNLLLNHEEFQRGVLDILSRNEKELSVYRQLYKEYKHVSEELADFIEQAEKNKQDEDYLQFQLQQLDEAKLSEDEQDALQQEADVLSHTEDIKASLYKADQLMVSDEGGFLSEMRDCQQSLEDIKGLYPIAGQWIERINSSIIDLKDLQHDIRKEEEKIDFNPDRLNFVNERLNLIYSLEQKHRVNTVKELINIADEYRLQLKAITSSDDEIKELKEKKAAIYNKVLEQSEILSKERSKAARMVEKQMHEYLVPLGMQNIRFEVEMKKNKEPDINGLDCVNFLFSANKNTPLQNVSSIASGGEIARVMLSLKAMIAGAVQLPTIIFDEIDTGVSGSIADKMAEMMQNMGKNNRQVISITHLPQIAAKGTVHYKVYKEDTNTGTSSHIIRLTDEQRVTEIANMLSGVTMTEEALNNARALLGYSNKQKNTSTK
ncbi:MAG: DNA repair protein RecN [Phocaeicola sp.]|uniref:DNA repair protein RecN n=1 Tax=Phocaeicola TaxID=909656 RepID=UPI00234F2EEE|nr:DNA repair protein RecN [Phocaeicola oris]MCE2615474.1 DNA repair protein RecN [Phocaeicola oris]